ncbi:transmembrane protein 41A-A [Eurytemora carolleeae]|uniref:transmembrane protein 41A-A n=1 Tax=Eurytemora carolleeae TaxID=1294199 RepID=UPI000C78C257|nr:transmembrane protein 41A-A [Eurytemora carolleeae]|eukprot:XP_023332965.1 transmembrane protein 41A-A-like [Eurytemora affinis]
MLGRIALVPLSAGFGVLLLYLLTLQAPQNIALKFPSSLEDLKLMSGTLNLFKTNHPTYVLLLFCSAYIFKQTFAVPGSVFLNILAGALYGTWPGFILCSVLSGTGASLCYILANLVGSEAARFYFPERISSFEKKLEENQAELPFFLLFLRLFPMSPNWALNMASGVLGVPLHLFFLSVFFGLMPYNYLCVTSGAILADIRDLADIMSWANMGRSAVAAAVALVPSILIKYRSNNKKR